MFELTVPVEDCYVSDHASLNEYREVREEWTRQLAFEDEGAIWDQIHDLVWNQCVFNLILESRELSDKAGEGFASQNWIVGSFIDRGYWSAQLLAIRRLMDPRHKDDRRQVISIPRLISDIECYSHLITRENYVCFDGIVYDYESDRREFYSKRDFRHQGETSSSALPSFGPGSFRRSEIRHEFFDRLSKTDPSNRQRNDGISDTYLNELKERLPTDDWQKIKRFADKRLAHASDPSHSDNVLSKKDLPDIELVQRSIRVLYETALLLSVETLNCYETDPLPTPVYGFMKGLDNSWIPECALGSLHTFWDQQATEIGNWRTELWATRRNRS